MRAVFSLELDVIDWGSLEETDGVYRKESREGRGGCVFMAKG